MSDLTLLEENTFLALNEISLKIVSSLISLLPSKAILSIIGFSLILMNIFCLFSVIFTSLK